MDYLAKINPPWKSKIFITSLVGLLASIFAVPGATATSYLISSSPSTLLYSAIFIFRTFFTGTLASNKFSASFAINTPWTSKINWVAFVSAFAHFIADQLVLNGLIDKATIAAFFVFYDKAAFILIGVLRGFFTAKPATP